jgi:methyl-accepting chemotaxis protein PixJ
LVFTLSQRIENPDTGEFLGVLKGFVDSSALNFLNNYLQDAGIQGSQQVQLLDVSSGFALATFSESGEVVPEDTSSALQVVGGRTISEIAAKVVEAVQGVQATSAEDLATSLSEVYPVEKLQIRELPTIEAGQGFIISFSYENKQFALSTVPQLDWVAIASMDISEVRAQGRDLLGVFSLIAALLGALAVVITISLSSRLSSPLNDLSDKARQVSAGNLDITAEPKGNQ